MFVCLLNEPEKGYFLGPRSLLLNIEAIIITNGQCKLKAE